MAYPPGARLPRLALTTFLSAAARRGRRGRGFAAAGGRRAAARGAGQRRAALPVRGRGARGAVGPHRQPRPAGRPVTAAHRAVGPRPWAVGQGVEDEDDAVLTPSTTKGWAWPRPGRSGPLSSCAATGTSSLTDSAAAAACILDATLRDTRLSPARLLVRKEVEPRRDRALLTGWVKDTDFLDL